MPRMLPDWLLDFLAPPPPPLTTLHPFLASQPQLLSAHNAAHLEFLGPALVKVLQAECQVDAALTGSPVHEAV
jgi:hypothetical protein